ncbi:MAG TPA: CocE/NonD family hydrolase [Terriglobales bacterium]|nr:CocE/NonD family hydrolase [Terriglobales bacterium]
MQALHRAIQGFISLSVLWLLTQGSGVAWAQKAAFNATEAPPLHGGTLEDWTSLSLAGSDLRAAKPVLGEKDEFPLFTRELIQVKWRLGDPIDLYVILPKGVSKPPVILYLYSYPSETDRFRNNDYCVRLTRDGYAAVGFVSALTGHRYANRPMTEWFVSELQESLVTSVHDVQMILDFLSTRNDLDLSKVGMFGTGSGGTIAILAAAVDPRIKALDALDPWGDWPTWMASSSIIPDNERPNYVKPEFLKKVSGLDPVEWLPKLNGRSIRIQQLLDDEVTPKLARDRIQSAAPAKAVIVRYQDGREFFHAVSGGRIFQWIKDSVRPPGQAQPATAQKSASTMQSTEPVHND